MNTPKRRNTAPDNPANDRVYLWLKFCNECQRLGEEKWILPELFQICQHMHYIFTTIIQSEEQKRQQYQLMQLQQQMVGVTTPKNITKVAEPSISSEELQLLHNSFDILQNVFKNELSSYAKSFSQYVKLIADSLPDMKQFLQQQQLNTRSENPIQLLWSALTSHGVKSDAEKVIYSLSTAYYTLFHEYDLDQFYYTGLNRNQTPVVGVFEESDEEEELVQDIIQEQILLPLEKKPKKKRKNPIVLQTIISTISFLLTVYRYNGKMFGKPILKLQRQEYTQLGLIGGGSFLLAWIVSGFLLPKLFTLVSKARVRFNEKKIVPEVSTNAPPNVLEQIPLPEMLDQLKEYFIRLIRLIKGHTEDMQQIELLVKKLNERQLFLDCSGSSLTPKKRRPSQVTHKNIENETLNVNAMFVQVGEQFIALNDKIQIFQSL